MDSPPPTHSALVDTLYESRQGGSERAPKRQAAVVLAHIFVARELEGLPRLRLARLQCRFELGRRRRAEDPDHALVRRLFAGHLTDVPAVVRATDQALAGCHEQHDTPGAASHGRSRLCLSGTAASGWRRKLAVIALDQAKLRAMSAFAGVGEESGEGVPEARHPAASRAIEAPA
jgi:hypothetical protein